MKFPALRADMYVAPAGMAAPAGAPALTSCACRGFGSAEGGAASSTVAKCTSKDWNGDGRWALSGRREGVLALVPRRAGSGSRSSQAPPSKHQQQVCRDALQLLTTVVTAKVNSDGIIGVTPPRLCRLGLRAQQQTRDDSSLSPQQWESSCSSSDSTAGLAASRRVLLSSVLLSSTALSFLRGERPAAASSSYREYIDRLDGYIFSYPSGWIQVRGAGADVFFRDPVNLDENLVVDFSSPSSSRYKSVEDLGTPGQAAQKVLKQKVTEFMSTRLGVRRESKIVSAKSRVGDDGRLYYDIEVDVKSFANTNELAVMPADRVAKLEWSRRYLSTLGVENNRLYELRLQAPEKVLAKEGTALRQIMNSFQLVKLEV